MKRLFIIIFCITIPVLSIKAAGFINSPSIGGAIIGLKGLIDVMVYIGLTLGIAGLLMDVLVREKKDGMRKGILWLVALGVYFIIGKIFF